MIIHVQAPDTAALDTAWRGLQDLRAAELSSRHESAPEAPAGARITRAARPVCPGLGAAGGEAPFRELPHPIRSR
jgi:hypothetical protein